MEYKTKAVPDLVVGSPPEPEAAPAPRLAARRIVKLVGDPTMWLIEDGKRRPIASSGEAAALGIPVEVVTAEELRQWAEGATYK